jgi:hypothetical protein
LSAAPAVGARAFVEIVGAEKLFKIAERNFIIVGKRAGIVVIEITRMPSDASER